MKRDTKHSRRSILSFGAKAAAAYGLSSLAAPAIRAAGSTNAACVCLYLLGGNDSNNMIVPLDSPAYETYARGRGPLAIPRGDLLSVYSTNASARFGFHPSLGGIRDLYSQGTLAVLANVGRWEGPWNRGQVRSNPRQLANDLFLHTGASQVRYLPNGYLAVPWAGSGPVSILQHGVTLAAPDGALVRDFSNSGAALATAFPRTLIGKRLQTVAGILKQGDVQQFAFLVPVEGFDTHKDQLATQAALFTDVNDAVVAFQNAMNEVGIADRVTLFTQSEFNRALAPNGKGGTEHGWGGHQLIMGRSTIGGQVYGQFPSLELGGPDDVGTSGVWIPSTPDVQYAATLARWMGRTDLNQVPEFAALRNFADSDLGFLAR